MALPITNGLVFNVRILQNTLAVLNVIGFCLKCV